MRKLASIQRIVNIAPIPGADAIERADVLGWSVVVKKGEFAVGDLAVYHEIDSFLPASEPAYAFLMDKAVEWEGASGVRLRTMKLRKQLSQGLLVPIASIRAFDDPKRSVEGGGLMEGDDVTACIGVRKWEPAEEKRSNSGGINKPAGTKQFPSFIRKTDQERVQNYVNELSRHADETFEVTVKLDGSSMTLFYVNESSPHFEHILADQEKRMLKSMGWWPRMLWKLRKRMGWLADIPTAFSGVCSRNIQLDTNGDNHFSQFYREHDIAERFKAFFGTTCSYAVQGELIGKSIQANHENVQGENEFYVFDIFDIDLQEYLPPVIVRGICLGLGLNYVPVLNTAMTIQDFEHCAADADDGNFNRYTVDMILAYAEGPGMNKGVKREGVVFKSNESPFSFKAISNSYLLKKESK